jgi:Domain of Unknown Function with PDB structure (DUF3857)
MSLNWLRILSPLIFIGSYTLAKEKELAKPISLEMQQNANAVKRTETYEIEYFNKGKAVLRHDYTITILNKEGDRFADLVVFYNTFQKVEAIVGNLYNSQGEKIKSLKKLDIKDYSAVSEMSLAF